MDKSMFCTLSLMFRLSFSLLLKLGAPVNRKLRRFCQYNKKFIPEETTNFPNFWHSLPIFISLHGYFAGKHLYFTESLAYVQQG